MWALLLVLFVAIFWAFGWWLAKSNNAKQPLAWGGGLVLVGLTTMMLVMPDTKQADVVTDAAESMATPAEPTRAAAISQTTGLPVTDIVKLARSSAQVIQSKGQAATEDQVLEALEKVLVFGNIQNVPIQKRHDYLLDITTHYAVQRNVSQSHEDAVKAMVSLYQEISSPDFAKRLEENIDMSKHASDLIVDLDKTLASIAIMFENEDFSQAPNIEDRLKKSLEDAEFLTYTKEKGALSSCVEMADIAYAFWGSLKQPEISLDNVQKRMLHYRLTKDDCVRQIKE